MRFTILAIAILCLSTLGALAQTTYGIKGIIADSASNGKMQNTTICILNAKDSTLYKFTRAGANGSFSINNLRKGKFLLLVSYPDYADYVEGFVLDSVKKERNFGKINLTLKSKLLSEVMIKGTKAQIKINGDTTEFNASSFTVQPNAKVEDLLKQLPGITVDKDGKITAQGQTVNKVLVDGEEFFGDDPTLVTKNLRADMVDKVQLYDKKSDQAAFTGIDDGVKNKTINIKLKEDKKSGYFGKIDAGAGTDGFYQGQALFNRFKAKFKLSAYVTLANTGKTGLSWEDNSKYGASSDNVQVSDDGGIFITGGGGDELESFGGNYNGRGIPVAHTGGVHYDTKVTKDKATLNMNYKAGELTVDGNNTSLTQNNLPGNVLNSSSDQGYHNYVFRQKLDAAYNLKIDTTANLKISADGTMKHSTTNSQYKTSSYRNMDTLLNQSQRSINNISDTKIFNASLFYSKKLKKKGRTFSVNLSEAYNEVDTHGYLNSSINFYNGKTTVLDSTQLINEYKTSNTKSSVLNSTFTYTEPLSKYLTLALNYGLNVNNGTSDRKTLDQTIATGEYNRFNSLLSNNFKLDQLSNQGGATFNLKKGKGTLNFGTKVTAVNFDQTNEYTNSVFKRNFLNWNPSGYYQYNFSQRNSIRFGYNGNTTQPTIDQIQPVFTNNDPLNVTLGNPDLKPSFNNSFNFYYNSYKVLSDQYFYISGSYSFRVNPIVSNTVTDYTTGKTTSQYSNLTTRNSSNFYVYSNFGRKVKFLGDINLGLNANVSGNTSYNYSNNALNTTTNNSYSMQLNVSRYSEKKYDIYFNFGPNYTVSGSSLQPNVNNNGFGLGGYSYVNLYLPKSIEFNYEANYQFKGKTQSFDQDFNQLLLNVTLSKKFLKEQNLKMSLTCNDILNQNVGFNRNAYGSTITQNSYTTIKRYFLFSVTYDFSHFGTTGAEKK
ncbi:TonB-dependent receptor [Mucilaginibacter sp. PPCGB 2223]|uniref:outer membrane beta-barrel family protein n=1 Tax=Mucilaginibacter sp. PPCGB 2223 TaxID=1886027 RepID=UPI000826C3B9|nr:outer membrane beta-barrel family protein [Mucilaginibacter sp. PPCGB 2223]OCX53992.1 TonB-dependent receptor [Mucilaginibacter sp. PPCGB 2223]